MLLRSLVRVAGLLKHPVLRNATLHYPTRGFTPAGFRKELIHRTRDTFDYTIVFRNDNPVSAAAAAPQRITRREVSPKFRRSFRIEAPATLLPSRGAHVLLYLSLIFLFILFARGR